MTEVVNPTPLRLKHASRLLARTVAVESGCVVIPISERRDYPQFSWGSGPTRVRRLAHVVAYDLFVGPIPDGHEVHHSCENKSCVNPSHLEALTPAEHIRRHPKNATACHADKTHCKNGHEFTPDNTSLSVDGRACLTCRRARSRDWISANKEKARLACVRYRARKALQSETRS